MDEINAIIKIAILIETIQLCTNYIHAEYISYLPTPPLGQDMSQGQFLSGV